MNKHNPPPFCIIFDIDETMIQYLHTENSIHRWHSYKNRNRTLSYFARDSKTLYGLRNPTTLTLLYGHTATKHIPSLLTGKLQNMLDWKRALLYLFIPAKK
jgi:hypothetical protein